MRDYLIFSELVNDTFSKNKLHACEGHLRGLVSNAAILRMLSKKRN